MNECINNLDQYKSYDDLPYIKLTVYEAVADLIYAQRKGLAATGVEYEKVYELLEDIYNRTDEMAVTQERSMEKQEKILLNMNNYYKEINSVYKNVEEK